MSEQAVQKPSSSGKLKIIGIIAGVVILEAVAAFFLLPSGTAAPAAEAAPASPPPKEEKPAAHAKPKEHGGHEKPASGHEKPEKEEAGKHAEAGEELEVDLGKFTVTSFQPSSNSTLMIDFHLFATIGGEDQSAYEKAYEENKHRVRDQIIVIIRGSEMTDLTDAGLGLIKRRILEKTNDILGKPLLRTVVFSEFAFMEQ
jgi:flagellar basal body-associated protein FliL